MHITKTYALQLVFICYTCISYIGVIYRRYYEMRVHILWIYTLTKIDFVILWLLKNEKM